MGLFVAINSPSGSIFKNTLTYHIRFCNFQKVLIFQNFKSPLLNGNYCLAMPTPAEALIKAVRGKGIEIPITLQGVFDMKFSIKALVNTAAILWGGSVFLTGIANMIWPNYGVAFLTLLDSIYPGYHHTGTIGSVIVATLYAVVDAAIAAALFGWIYNKFAVTKEEQVDEEEE